MAWLVRPCRSSLTPKTGSLIPMAEWTPRSERTTELGHRTPGPQPPPLREQLTPWEQPPT